MSYTLKVFTLKQSEDGNFFGKEPIAFIDAKYSPEERKRLCDEYTGGQFSKYSGFYELSEKPISLRFLKK